MRIFEWVARSFLMRLLYRKFGWFGAAIIIGFLSEAWRSGTLVSYIPW